MRVFGSSSLAISTTLASFMAGLAIGSLLGGKIADKHQRSPKRLLALYALFEISIAILGGALLPLSPAFSPFNAWLWELFSDSPFVLGSIRFLFTSILLLLPTTLMGATLPILVRQFGADPSKNNLSSILGFLYSANTLGALLGAFCSGFIFLELFGLAKTNIIAISAAFATGCIALALTKSSKTTAAPDARSPLKGDKPKHKGRRLALCLYAVSGFVAMAYEVLWSRTLAIVLGSSTYSFSLVLCAFLAGLSLGGYLTGRFYKSKNNPYKPLMLIFFLTSITSLIAFETTDMLPELFLELLASTDLSASNIRHLHFFIALFTIMPTSVGLGAVMPLAIDAFAGNNKDTLGDNVGTAYSFNTLGAIAGAISAGFLMMPLWGLETTHRILIVSSLVMALCSFWASKSRMWQWPTIFGCLALMACTAKPWNKSKLTTGLFRTHQAVDYLQKSGLFDRNVTFYKDGHTTTVTVEDFGHGWVLRNNGKVEASSNHDMPTQILVGLLPVLLHPEKEQKIFMLGYGSGVTVGSMAIAPQVSSVEVAELEPAVYEAADKYFSKHNNAPENNPKVHRYIGDGRNLLLSNQGTYDVIVSEPSNPWIAGVSTLFTKEFYELAKNKLSPGGLFCQWAQLYELGTPNVKMIYNTFADSFKYVYAFTPGDRTTDTILIGSDHPLPLSLASLRNNSSSKEVQLELMRASIKNVTELFASLFLGPSDIPSFTAGADLNTDDNLNLEFAAPKDLLTSTSGSELGPLIRSEQWPYGNDVIDLEGYTEADVFQLAQSYLKYGRFRSARSLYSAPTNLEHKQIIERWIAWLSPMAFFEPEEPLNAENREFPKAKDIPFTPASSDGHLTIPRLYESFAKGDWKQAWALSREIPQINNSLERDDIVLLKAFLEYKTMHFKKSLKLLNQLKERKSDRKAVHYYIARASLGLGRFTDALNAIKKYDELVTTK